MLVTAHLRTKSHPMPSGLSWRNECRLVGRTGSAVDCNSRHMASSARFPRSVKSTKRTRCARLHPGYGTMRLQDTALTNERGGSQAHSAIRSEHLTSVFKPGHAPKTRVAGLRVMLCG